MNFGKNPGIRRLRLLLCSIGVLAWLMLILAGKNNVLWSRPHISTEHWTLLQKVWKVDAARNDGMTELEIADWLATLGTPDEVMELVKLGKKKKEIENILGDRRKRDKIIYSREFWLTTDFMKGKGALFLLVGSPIVFGMVWIVLTALVWVLDGFLDKGVREK